MGYRSLQNDFDGCGVFLALSIKNTEGVARTKCPGRSARINTVHGRAMNLTREELEAVGFALVGENVRVHQSAVFYGVDRISIGDNSRIDCFSILSAGTDGIEIGQNVHLGAGCYLFGGGGRIEMADFSGLSSRVAIYTASDDYTDGYMTNPTVPDEFRKVESGPVSLGRHAIVGAGSVVLPNVTIHTGAAVGALTCVRRDVAEFAIVAGRSSVGKVVGERKRLLLELEKQYREQLDSRAA